MTVALALLFLSHKWHPIPLGELHPYERYREDPPRIPYKPVKWQDEFPKSGGLSVLPNGDLLEHRVKFDIVHKGRVYKR